MPLALWSLACIEPASRDAVWYRHDAEATAAALGTVAAGVLTRVAAMTSLYGKAGALVHAHDLETRTWVWAGRLIIGVRGRQEGIDPALTIELAAILAGQALEALLLEAQPDELCRAVLTHGPLDADDQRCQGPALAEILDHARHAVGCAFWLTPTATELLESRPLRSAIFDHYDVPMRTGPAVLTRACRLRLRPEAEATALRRARAVTPDAAGAAEASASLRYLAWCRGDSKAR